jgi:hypothetical protein
MIKVVVSKNKVRIADFGLRIITMSFMPPELALPIGNPQSPIRNS